MYICSGFSDASTVCTKRKITYIYLYDEKKNFVYLWFWRFARFHFLSLDTRGAPRR